MGANKNDYLCPDQMSNNNKVLELIQLRMMWLR